MTVWETTAWEMIVRETTVWEMTVRETTVWETTDWEMTVWKMTVLKTTAKGYILRLFKIILRNSNYLKICLWKSVNFKNAFNSCL